MIHHLFSRKELHMVLSRVCFFPAESLEHPQPNLGKPIPFIHHLISRAWIISQDTRCPGTSCFVVSSKARIKQVAHQMLQQKVYVNQKVTDLSPEIISAYAKAADKAQPPPHRSQWQFAYKFSGIQISSVTLVVSGKKKNETTKYTTKRLKNKLAI